MSINATLLNYWKTTSDASVQLPVSREKIDNFERKHSVELPLDFIQSLMTANGFDQSKNYQDSNGFNFLPLEDLQRVSECEDGNYKFADAERYFIFCDYLDSSWAYAIHADGRFGGSVLLIGTRDGIPQAVAKSFSKFVNLYLNDDRILYPIAK